MYAYWIEYFRSSQNQTNHSILESNCLREFKNGIDIVVDLETRWRESLENFAKSDIFFDSLPGNSYFEMKSVAKFRRWGERTYQLKVSNAMQFFFENLFLL